MFFFFSRLLFLLLCVVPSYIWFDCIVICLLFADWYVDMWLKQPYVKFSNEKREKEKKEISKPNFIIIYTHKSKCTLMNRCFFYVFICNLTSSFSLIWHKSFIRNAEHQRHMISVDAECKRFVHPNSSN